ncbi:MAG TPA: Ig-like domain-containing protein [Kofleriaceae bacterium]
MVVLLVSCSGDDDSSPPTVVAITPSDGAAEVWLHDPITVTFSEAIDPDSVSATTVVVTAEDGSVLPAAAALDATGTVLTVRAADDIAVLGGVRLALAAGITDRAGNALVETTFGWTLPAWSRADTSGLTPSLAIGEDGRLVVASSIGGASGRRIIVNELGATGMTALGGELGEGDAALPSITFDAQGRPVLVWSEFTDATAAVRAARWDGSVWLPLPSPGDGAFAVAARAPGAEPVVAYTTSASLAGTAQVRLRRLVDDTWQPLAADIAVAGAVVGLPQLVMATSERPVVAFAETASMQGGLTNPSVRVLRWTGSWLETSIAVQASTNQATEITRVAVAARGDNVVVAYDTFNGFSYGVYVGGIDDRGWFPLGGELDVDSAGNAQAPALALDADGAPIVAWRELVEDNWRGFVARWNGKAWVAVGGGAWNADATRAIVRPMMTLAADRTPVIAWADESIHVARWNGPAVPRFGIDARAPLTGCSFDGTQTTLGATGCFTIANGRATPHAGLVPFDIVSELWSDGARKRRWIALPDGQSLTVAANGAWIAPPGTMLVKEFAIETTTGDPRTRRVMETRFLINSGSGITSWQGYSFRWRAEGNDADLLPDAASTVDWPLDNGMAHTHSYPSRAQCARCHHASNGPLLGVRTGQLARRFDYDGVMGDQLETFAHIGVIAQPSEVRGFVSPHDASAPLEQRMRGYLAANCSHCHNPGGERPTRDFRWETPLAQTNLCGPDSEIVAGHPEQSVLFVRISTRVNGMPPLATLKTDPLAIDVIGRWITGEVNCL